MAGCSEHDCQLKFVNMTRCVKKHCCKSFILVCICSLSRVQTHTAFMTFCSNVKSWSNADSCMDNRLWPCEHISLKNLSHIFIVELCSRVGRQRESAISSARWEVTVFFNCKTIVVSVTARSRLGTALYTVGKETANCKIRLRNNAHRICLMSMRLTSGCGNLGVASLT